MQTSLVDAIEKNRDRTDIQLSSGRTIRRMKMENGSYLATPTSGPQEMTPIEWTEYCQKLRDGSKVGSAISSRRFGNEPYEHETD